ncbi:MAG: FeoB-associated Cys-rich membrane protein [Prevotellaceae bacterium]|nr:FeoB-associated Cys-rich membrane protein [Prevotellaceae bacterium]
MQNIIVIFIVAGALSFVVWKFYKILSVKPPSANTPSCCAGCSGCSVMKEIQHQNRKCPK